MTSEGRDVILSKNMVEFTLHMAQEFERISRKFYEEPDKTPDVDIKIRSSQQGTIYSNMQTILYNLHYNVVHKHYELLYFFAFQQPQRRLLIEVKLDNR
jgi:hypothetical protein